LEDNSLPPPIFYCGLTFKAPLLPCPYVFSLWTQSVFLTKSWRSASSSPVPFHLISAPNSWPLLSLFSRPIPFLFSLLAIAGSLGSLFNPPLFFSELFEGESARGVPPFPLSKAAPPPLLIFLFRDVDYPPPPPPPPFEIALIALFFTENDLTYFSCLFFRFPEEIGF